MTLNSNSYSNYVNEIEMKSIGKGFDTESSTKLSYYKDNTDLKLKKNYNENMIISFEENEDLINNLKRNELFAQFDDKILLKASENLKNEDKFNVCYKEKLFNEILKIKNAIDFEYVENLHY